MGLIFVKLFHEMTKLLGGYCIGDFCKLGGLDRPDLWGGSVDAKVVPHSHN